MRRPHSPGTPLRVRQRFFLIAALAGSIWFFSGKCAKAASAGVFAAEETNIRQILDDAGLIGIVLIVLSVAMLALIIEHLISFRRNALMPSGLAEDVHQFLQQGQIKQARQICQEHPSFLSHVLSSGLGEMNYGYTAVEKSMEDSSVEQSARLFRKIEFLSVIGTIAPMLGLLGTVWGLMVAFQEFELKTKPDISDLAPGIRKAMVTTLMGLTVAVPSLAAFALFRTRIDGLVAESSLMAEHVFSDFKHSLVQREKRLSTKPRESKPAVGKDAVRPQSPRAKREEPS